MGGPATVVSSGGAKYFLTCYDDFTRKINLTFLKAKSEAFIAMTHYIAKVECQPSCKVQTIRSDNGGEFTSKQWEQHMLQHGIQHIRVPPDAHAQNGRVERVHLTILNDVRTILLNSGLPAKYWAEAAN
jgi:transposase InsO family protein